MSSERPPDNMLPLADEYLVELLYDFDDVHMTVF